MQKLHDGQDSSPIFVENHEKLIAKFIAKNIDQLNATNRDGNTALHTAAFLGQVKTIEQLVEAGASTTIKGKVGTPLEYYQAMHGEMSDPKIVSLLK